MLPYTPLFGMRNDVAAVPNQLMINNISKDSQWLTLEVCREFQRGLCPRNDLECKYAHPPSYLETVNGRVVCCYDSIKGKCHRVKPPCKYMHPPQHLKDILIQNGKNNLLMKNLQMNILQQQLSTLSGTTPSMVGLMQVNPKLAGENPSLAMSEPLVSHSSNGSCDVNYSELTKDMSQNHIGVPSSTECQMTQVLSNKIETPLTGTVIASPSLSSVDMLIGKKRPIAQLYQNGGNANFYMQHTLEEPGPMKRPALSDAHLQACLINQDRVLNPMGSIYGIQLNPFMTYQNPLAPYLTMNNQNFSALMTTSPQLPSFGPGFIGPGPQVAGITNLSMLPNIMNQPNLAMLLHAANLQGNRVLSDFSTFK